MAWLGSESNIRASIRPFSARPHNPQTDTSGDIESMMCDLVLGDIQAEISRIEQESEKKRQDCLREAKTPDYSWLMDWRLKSKKILTVREGTEVELLCAKVRPKEWNRLIREWRTRVKFIESREEVIALFRSIVDEIMRERYERQTSLQNINEFDNYSEEAAGKIQRPRTTQTIEFLTSTPPAELSVFALSHNSLTKSSEAQNVV